MITRDFKEISRCRNARHINDFKVIKMRVEFIGIKIQVTCNHKRI